MIGSFGMLIVPFAVIPIMKQTEETRNPLPSLISISSELTASDSEPLSTSPVWSLLVCSFGWLVGFC